MAAASRGDTKVVYNDIMDVDDSDGDADVSAEEDERDSEQDDTDQTMFLLGLQ